MWSAPPAVSDASEGAIRALGMLALARRAEAALTEATAGQEFASVLSVTVVEPGTVRVSGNVDMEKTRSAVEAVLRAVKGVETVENMIQVAPPRRTGV